MYVSRPDVNAKELHLAAFITLTHFIRPSCLHALHAAIRRRAHPFRLRRIRGDARLRTIQRSIRICNVKHRSEQHLTYLQVRNGWL
jgi:hypothetical protein